MNQYLMNSLSLFLRYARYRYIGYRLLLRVKIGKKKRDEYLRNRGISIIAAFYLRGLILLMVLKQYLEKAHRTFTCYTYQEKKM